MLPVDYTVSFTSGNSHSETVRFREVYDWMTVRVPSTSGVIGANEPIYFEESGDGSTWYRMAAPIETNTGVVGGIDIQLKSGISLHAVPFARTAGDYLRIRLSAGVEANGDMQVVFVGHTAR